MANCGCANNYDETTFMESFGQDDKEMKNCNKCPNMDYEDGVMTCKKFNKEQR